MRKSREFDNVLDECLERLLTKGETIEQCLRSFPKHADELKPLLEAALAIKKASAIQPSSEFREKARYQFYSAFREVEQKRSRSFLRWNWQPQWATVVAIALALLMAGSGTVVAASGSMPDEPLYPVKLATEQARLILTPSALGKAEFYAKLADRRVLEIVRMADKNKPEQIERTTHRLDIYLTRIADLASTQVPGAPAMAPTGEFQVTDTPFMPPMVGEKEGVGEVPLPPEGANRSMVASTGFDRRAKLRTMVGRYAFEHPERMRAILEEVHASARPALLRAIEISETDYTKVLKSLE